MNSKYDIYENIKDHIKSFGYRVVSSNIDSWDSKTKTVCSCTKRGIDKRNIYLLHELGHIYLYQKINYKDKFASLLAYNESCRFKVSTIEQEVLAWEEAEKLALKFGIEIDDNFYKCKFESLKTYIL